MGPIVYNAKSIKNTEIVFELYKASRGKRYKMLHVKGH